MTKLLSGKKCLIVGLASNRSIAAGIAQSFHGHGAELAFTYQNEKLQSRVTKMAESWGSELVYPCDVSLDIEISAVFEQLNQHWDGIDVLVHSVAFAPADQLEGDFTDCTTRAGFNTAHEISSYSLTALAKAGRELLTTNKGSIITLSYLGAEKAVPNYNVMGLAKASLEANVRYLATSLGEQGIRVNGISAGPIKTLAAAGIKNFRSMLNHHAQHAPLKRNVSAEDVGNVATFLGSKLAYGVTGEIIHVDSGFSCVSSIGE